MTEAPELLYFSSHGTKAPEILIYPHHGTSSAHPSPSTVKQTIENVSDLRAKVAAGSARVLLVGNGSTGKTALINALGDLRRGRTEQSVGQWPIVLWDIADGDGVTQISDEPIELASVAEDVAPPTDRAQPAAHAAFSCVTDLLQSSPSSGESTRDELIWPDLSVCDPTAFGPWSRYHSAAVKPITVSQYFEYGCQGIVVVPCTPFQTLRENLGCRAFRLTFQDDALPTGGTAFLRFIDGILAALRLMLVLVLATLSQQLDALDFVLVILAACLRYGRREEPDDYASLPMRRNKTSLGWCPQG